MRRAAVLRLLAPLLMVSACDTLPTETAYPDGAGFAAARVAVPPVATRPDLLVSAQWLQRHADRPNVVVLHVGTPAGYAAAHVDGARFVDLAAIQGVSNGVAFMLRAPHVLRDVLEAAGISTANHVIVTGDGALAAARGFFILDYLGHPRVSLLDGGLPAWRAAGGATVTGAPAAVAAGVVRTPVRDERLIDVADVVAQLGTPGAVLMDARPAANFVAGRLPGAVSLPWANLVESPVQVLRPVDQLRQLFAAAGVDRRTDLVVYCTSGMMSSVSYFVARYLGYDVQLYDGSFLEWTALNLPTES